jgi:hypothetical protein
VGTVGIKMTEQIEITNITLNRLRNYFPNMSEANAIRELLKIALDNGFLDVVHNAHRDSQYYDVWGENDDWKEPPIVRPNQNRN